MFARNWLDLERKIGAADCNLHQIRGPTYTQHNATHIHFEAGDPASVVEWRGRPRFQNRMSLAKQCAVEADRHFKFISKRVIPRR